MRDQDDVFDVPYQIRRRLKDENRTHIEFLLLSNGIGFGVCKVDWRRRIVTAPNFAAGCLTEEEGKLTGKLSDSGIAEVLDFVTEIEANRRFATLTPRLTVASRPRLTVVASGSAEH